MQLIPNARRAWRMFSVQAMTLAGALQGAWLALPPDLTQHVPAGAVHGVTLTLLVAGIVGRLVQQPKVQP